jgi:hypothetical protein
MATPTDCGGECLEPMGLGERRIPDLRGFENLGGLTKFEALTRQKKKPIFFFFEGKRARE